MAVIPCHLPYCWPLLKPFSPMRCLLPVCQMLSLQACLSRAPSPEPFRIVSFPNYLKLTLALLGNILPVVVWFVCLALGITFVATHLCIPFGSPMLRLIPGDPALCRVMFIALSGNASDRDGRETKTGSRMEQVRTWVVSPKRPFQRGSTFIAKSSSGAGHTFIIYNTGYVFYLWKYHCFYYIKIRKANIFPSGSASDLSATLVKHYCLHFLSMSANFFLIWLHKSCNLESFSSLNVLWVTLASISNFLIVPLMKCNG